MIMDGTGIELVPGNMGVDCPGNGEYGECCCDECDYMMCCLADHQAELCLECVDRYCPRVEWLEDGNGSNQSCHNVL